MLRWCRNCIVSNIYEIMSKINKIIALLFVCNFSNQTVLAADLDGLIREALLTYPTILSKQASRDAAQSDLTASKLKFLPTPTVSTQRNQVEFDGGNPKGNMPATNVSVSQPIWMGGGLIAGYQKSDARLSAADYSLLETREDVSKRVVTSYGDWLRAWLKIQALEKSVALHEKFVGLISRRYDQGVASGADRDLAVSRLMQARADLDSQKSSESTALASISELVGGLITRDDLAAKLSREVKLPVRKEGLNKALVNSVTVQRYKYEAEAAEAEAKEIKAQALPQVSFQAQRQIGNAYYPGSQGFNAYGIVVSYAPGGGGFSSIVTANAAMERARASVLQVESAKREIADRLNAEYNDYEYSQLKIESLKRSADLSGGISASYDRQYLVGRKSWLDLMNAVRERVQSEVVLADAQASLVSSSRRLLIYIDGTQQFEIQR